jgi:FlaA1/EpsC-like NDP-sugar epimerase
MFSNWGGGKTPRANIAIVGAGNEGQRLIAKLQQSRDPSFVVCGVFDDRKSRLDPVVTALPLYDEQRLKVLCDKLKIVAMDIRLSGLPGCASSKF